MQGLRILDVVCDPDDIARILHGARAAATTAALSS